MNRRTAIGGLLILTGVAGGGVVLSRSVVQPQLESRKRKAEARKKAEDHLETSVRTSAVHIEERLDDIRAFFAEASKGVPAFSEKVLGWNSKWKLIKEKAQFWKDGGKHQEFVQSSFAELVFKPEDLVEAIRKAVENFVARDGEAVNNQFLLAIRGDVPIEFLDYQGAPDRFEPEATKRINSSFVKSAEATYGDLGKDAGTFAASSVASAIAAQVLVRIGTSIAVRFGLSAAILGAGAAASPFTLGLSLIAAVVIDLALGWLVNFFTDPAGKLAESVQEELKKLEILVIEGSEADESGESVTGLRQELEHIAEMQSRSRREAIGALLPSLT